MLGVYRQVPVRMPIDGHSTGRPSAARLLFARGLGRASAELLNLAFLFGIGVFSVLAIATEGRFFFVSLLGERVVADLRKSVYRHILTLDTIPAAPHLNCDKAIGA